jgi:cytochrome b561
LLTRQTKYGSTAKAFHWVIVGLISVQAPLGWLMPDVRRGMMPGSAMSLHVSIGMTILTLMLLRLIWRLTHPVAPESSLPGWQHFISESVHWLLYLTVLGATLSGWLFESARGWTIRLYGVLPLPHLVAEGSPFGHTIGELHATMVWVLLSLVSIHILAALVHAVVYRDRIIQRMLWSLLQGRMNGR